MRQILTFFLFFTRIEYQSAIWTSCGSVASWAEFQQSVVDVAVDQWRKRLEACIRAEGGQFEHLSHSPILPPVIAKYRVQNYSQNFTRNPVWWWIAEKRVRWTFGDITIQSHTQKTASSQLTPRHSNVLSLRISTCGIPQGSISRVLLLLVYTASVNLPVSSPGLNHQSRPTLNADECTFSSASWTRHKISHKQTLCVGPSSWIIVSFCLQLCQRNRFSCLCNQAAAAESVQIATVVLTMNNTWFARIASQLSIILSIDIFTCV